MIKNRFFFFFFFPCMSPINCYHEKYVEMAQNTLVKLSEICFYKNVVDFQHGKLGPTKL